VASSGFCDDSGLPVSVGGTSGTGGAFASSGSAGKGCQALAGDVLATSRRAISPPTCARLRVSVACFVRVIELLMVPEKAIRLQTPAAGSSGTGRHGNVEWRMPNQ